MAEPAEPADRRPAKRPRLKQDERDRLGSEGNLIHNGDRGVRLARPRIARARNTRGRLTSESDRLFLGTIATIVSPEDYDENWSVVEMHRDALDRFTPAELLNVLMNLSPQMARGIWDWLRLCNPDVSITAYQVGTQTIHTQAQDVLDEFREVTLARRHGSEKALYNRLFFGAMYGGAFFSELVLDRAGRVPLDIAIPDPFSVRFRRRKDPELGDTWDLGQWQSGQFVVLDSPNISYIAVDAKPGRPYGRPMLVSAIFPCLFLMGLFTDLRRVVAQQGWPRIDIAVALDRLILAYPTEHKKGGATWDNRVDRTLGTIETVFESLEADDTFVHTDDSIVNRPKGSLDSQAIASAATLIDALLLSTVQGLKSQPLMMGITDGVSEANANRQWEMITESVDTLQDYAEQSLEAHYTNALQAQGIAADVLVEFEKVRQSEELRIEQARELRIANVVSMMAEGFLTWQEAAAEALEREPSPEAIQDHQDAEKAAEEAAAALADAGPVDGATANEDQSGATSQETLKTLDAEARALSARIKAQDDETVRKAVDLASIKTRRSGYGSKHHAR